MARLPQPGGDNGNWGSILNDFLSQSLTSTGEIKASAVGTSHIADGSISAVKIADGSVTTEKLATTSTPTSGQVLGYDGNDLSWTTVSGSGTTPDADSTTKGLVQLAGSLSGTAASPTVVGVRGVTVSATAPTAGQVLTASSTTAASWTTPATAPVTSVAGRTGVITLTKADVGLGSVDNTSDANKPVSTATQTALTAKANDSAVVHLAGAETVTGAKNFTGGLQVSGSAVVTTSDSRLSDDRTPLAASVTPAKLASVAAPTSGQYLSYNGTQFLWVAAPTGGADPTMGGDLTGTASNAQIAANAVGTAELAANAVTTAKITDGNVTVAKLDSAAAPTSGQYLSYNGTKFAWVAAPTGGADPTMGGDLTGTASNAQIATGAVGTAELANTSVTTAKLADANVTTSKIADGNVTTVKVADNSLTEPKLAIANTPATNQVLSWNGTTMAWATPSTSGGGRTVSAVITASAYTANANEYVIVNPTANMVTVTLPTGGASGTWVTIKRRTASGNSILVMAGGSDKIEYFNGSSSDYNATSDTVNGAYASQDYIYDGVSQWYRVG